MSIQHRTKSLGWSEAMGWRRLMAVFGSALLLELKFVPEFAQEADRVTNALPFRMARFSKYGTGLERI